MARMHKLWLTLASGSALYSGLVPALGLGGITLHSALNQPLEADIQLLEVGDLDSNDVRVRLASEEDFARSGVERLFFLNDLRFTPMFKDGRNVIRVVSSKPVREPYLNFVIEVARPNGQLFREYTLLLDPPGASAYNAVAATSPAALPAPVKPREVRPSQALPAATQGRHYTVQRGDSLWLIARRLRDDGSPMRQQALIDGLHGLNPQAFVDGDIDRLKLGASLLLPDAAIATAPATAAAPASVTEVPSVAAAVPAATTQAALPTAGTPAVSAAVPTESSTALADVQRRLDQELAARAEENRQLQASMAALQAQLGELQVQMNAKDQQLALMRADLANAQAQTPSVATEAVPVAPVAVPADTASPAAPTVATPMPAPTGESSNSLLAWLLAGGTLTFALLAGLAWRVRGRQSQLAAVSGVSPRQPLPNITPKPAVAAAPAVSRPAASFAPRGEADPLEGANIYIAYGRFSEALSVLRQAVAREPQRTDLRFRLLEVLGELGDSTGFMQEEASLRELGMSKVQLDQVCARYADKLIPVPAPELDEALLVADEAPQSLLAESTQSPELLDDFQLNLDDLSLDADWDQVSPFAPAAATRSKPVAVAPVANDPAFRSNLRQLPEVSELEHDELSPFSDWNPVAGEDAEVLHEEFLDAFDSECKKTLAKPALKNLDHLASNKDNLIKLNKALAYIEQGDLGSACSILNEVISDGDDQQRREARELLARIA